MTMHPSQSAPLPPQFTPADRFLAHGQVDCSARGHVYRHMPDQAGGMTWICLVCGGRHIEVQTFDIKTTPGPGQFPLDGRPLPVWPRPPLPYINHNYSGSQPANETGCAWDNIPPEDRGKPMLLSCQCPRCSPRC